MREISHVACSKRVRQDLLAYQSEPTKIEQAFYESFRWPSEFTLITKIVGDNEVDFRICLKGHSVSLIRRVSGMTPEMLAKETIGIRPFTWELQVREDGLVVAKPIFTISVWTESGSMLFEDKDHDAHGKMLRRQTFVDSMAAALQLKAHTIGQLKEPIAPYLPENFPDFDGPQTADVPSKSVENYVTVRWGYISNVASHHKRFTEALAAIDKQIRKLALMQAIKP